MEEIFNYKKQIIIVISIVIIMSIIVFCYFANKHDDEIKIEQNDTILNDEEEDIEEIEEDNITFYVDIKGEVLNPGVYNIVKNSIVNDVIVLAGGLTKNADTTCVNLSKKITDEMVIYINSKSEIKKMKEEKEIVVTNEKICSDVINGAYNSSTTEEITSNSKININSATIEELTTLPGIGEEKAKNIIEYRTTNNGFKDITEIKNISGIGDALFNNIKDLITI